MCYRMMPVSIQAIGSTYDDVPVTGTSANRNDVRMIAVSYTHLIFDQSMTDQNHPYYNCNGWSSTYVEFSDGSTKYSIYWY